MSRTPFTPLPCPSWMERFLPVNQISLILVIAKIIYISLNPADEWLQLTWLAPIWVTLATLCWMVLFRALINADEVTLSTPDALWQWFQTNLEIWRDVLLFFLACVYSTLQVAWFVLWRLKELFVAISSNQLVLRANARMRAELTHATLQVAELNDRVSRLKNDVQQAQQVRIKEWRAPETHSYQHQMYPTAVSDKLRVQSENQKLRTACDQLERNLELADSGGLLMRNKFLETENEGLRSQVAKATTVESGVQTDDVAEALPSTGVAEDAVKELAAVLEDVQAELEKSKTENSALQKSNTELEATIRQSSQTQLIKSLDELQSVKKEREWYKAMHKEEMECRINNGNQLIECDQWRVKFEGERNDALQKSQRLQTEKDTATEDLQRCQGELGRVNALLHQYQQGDDRMVVAQQEVERIKNEAIEYQRQVQVERQQLDAKFNSLWQSFETGKQQFIAETHAKQQVLEALKTEQQAKEQAQRACKAEEAAKLAAEKARDKAVKLKAEKDMEYQSLKDTANLRLSKLKKAEQACEKKDEQIHDLRVALGVTEQPAPSEMEIDTPTWAEQLAAAEAKHKTAVDVLSRQIEKQAERIKQLLGKNEELDDKKFNVEREKNKLSRTVKELNEENKEKAAALGTANSERATALEKVQSLEQDKQFLTDRADVLNMSLVMYREQAINTAPPQPPQSSKYAGMKRTAEEEQEKSAKKHHQNEVEDVTQPSLKQQETRLQNEPAQPAIEE